MGGGVGTRHKALMGVRGSQGQLRWRLQVTHKAVGGSCWRLEGRSQAVGGQTLG